MDRRFWMSTAAVAIAATVLIVWGSLQGHSVHGHVAVGLFVLCPYAAITVHRRDVMRGWQNVFMALGTTLAIGVFASRFSDFVPGTLVSADSVIAAALGVVLVICWGIARLRNPTSRWYLAVGLTYTISGAVFAFLDLALNYGPK